MQAYVFIGAQHGTSAASRARMPNDSEPSSTPDRNGIRERLAIRGEAVLSDSELIALVLATGAATDAQHVIATQLLSVVGGLHGLAAIGVDRLSDQRGIGVSKACRLRASVELGRRLATTPLCRGVPISGSRDVDAALRPRLRAASREHFLAIPLDARNRPLAEIDVAIGGLTACALTPADVFREVLRWPAVSVVFAHNHPSGDARPSPEDLEVTERLRAAGALIGVEVLDHVIIGESGYFSFLDHGLLSARKRPLSP